MTAPRGARDEAWRAIWPSRLAISRVKGWNSTGLAPNKLAPSKLEPSKLEPSKLEREKLDVARLAGRPKPPDVALVYYNKFLCRLNGLSVELARFNLLLILKKLARCRRLSGRLFAVPATSTAAPNN